MNTPPEGRLSEQEQMRSGFYVQGLSSQVRLQAKLEEIKHRGAPEASWIFAQGEVGFAKSKTLTAIGLKQTSIMVLAKAKWSALWMLNEMAEQIGISRKHTVQAQFETVLGALMEKQPLIIVDEMEHVARKQNVIQTLRGLTDMSECVLLAGGTKEALEIIRGYKDVHSRIFDVVTFGPADAKEIRTMAEALIDIKLADDLICEIQRRTGGRHRLIMNALARVEAYARKNRLSKLGLTEYGNRQLTNDEPARAQLAVVANNG